MGGLADDEPDCVSYELIHVPYKVMNEALVGTRHVDSIVERMAKRLVPYDYEPVEEFVALRLVEKNKP